MAQTAIKQQIGLQMYKTAVCTHVNGDRHATNTPKTAKIIKR